MHNARGSFCYEDCAEGKSWRMKFGGLTSLNVKKERDKKMGKKAQKCDVAQNSIQKWVGFNMSGVADVKSWKIV